MNEELQAARVRAADRETAALIAKARAVDAARKAGAPVPKSAQPFVNVLERLADEDGSEEIERDGGIQESAAPIVSIPAMPSGAPDKSLPAQMPSAGAPGGAIQIPRVDSADAPPAAALPSVQPEERVLSSAPPAPLPVAALSGDTAAAVNFLQRMPHPFPTLTAIPVDPVTHEKLVKQIETKSFPSPVDWDAVAKWIDGYQGRANLYWSTNPLREPKNKKSAKSDIAEVVMLQVDVDTPEGEEQEFAIAAMLAKVDRLEHAPTFIINSGGGLQLFYMLIESDRIKLNGDADIAAAEALTRGVELAASKALGVEADATYNCDRIMRLPGTVNIPDKKKVLKKRKAALAKLIVTADWEKYPRSAFTPAPAAAAPSGSSLQPATNDEDSWQALQLDWDEVARQTPTSLDDGLIATLPERVRVLLAITDTSSIDVVNDTLAEHKLKVKKPFDSWSAVPMSIAASMKSSRRKFSDTEKAAVLSSGFPVLRHIHQQTGVREKRRAILRVLGRSYKIPQPDAPEGMIVVGPGDWSGTAALFKVKEFPNLKHYNDEFLEFNGACYREAERATVESKTRKFLDGCRVWKGETYVPFLSNNQSVNETVRALQHACHVSRDSYEAPSWLDGGDGYPSRECVVMQNCILHVPSRTSLAHTSNFFTTIALPFAFDPKAECPLWHEKLREWFPQKDGCDAEEIALLQEMFGYIVMSDTRRQKLFLLLGPGRSGKGTIAKVLQSLVGADNCAAPSLHSLGEQFGRQCLIDKSLAVISETAFGQHDDKILITGYIKAITGEDTSTVPRKNRPDWVGHLLSRFLLLANTMPAFPDASEAFGARLIIIKMTRSFKDVQDPTLFDKLCKQLPGIFLWALAGHARLQANGCFTEPQATRDAQEESTRRASPVREFIEERYEVDGTTVISEAELYTDYVRWCSTANVRPGNKNDFIEDCEAYNRALIRKYRPMDGDRKRSLKGLKRRAANDNKKQPSTCSEPEFEMPKPKTAEDDIPF